MGRWTAFVVLVGVGLSGLAGILAVPALGARDAFVWTVSLAYLFGLGYGSNRLQFALLDSPSRVAKAFVGTVVFLPMFLGWFPISSWLHGQGFSHGWNGLPSPFWIVTLMFWGLFAPGGIYVSIFKRLSGRTTSP